MTDIKFNLERSQYFNNRTKLMSSNGVPKLSDAKSNLGDSLAKVVFDQCEEALKKDFGLKVPLEGPGDILWVSPSDLLIGKVALKPPFTPKCLQALTHKGILEIGEDLENKFKQEMELEKQRTLEKYKAELLATIEDRMKSEIKDVEIRERLNCHMEVEKLQQEFEYVLKAELDNLERKIRHQYEQIIDHNEHMLQKKWEDKLKEEVNNTVEKMTTSFLIQLEDQEEKLTNAFELELRKKDILRDFDAKRHKSKMAEALRILKHNLECTNLVNMMYVLCTERRKCCEKKQEIESYYQKLIDDLQEKIIQKDETILTLTKEKEHQIQEVSLRETCLLEVIKHFQKFINFALRAAPTQAEFLLSVEKMMVFELTKTVAKSEFPDFQTGNLIIPWDNESKTKTSSVMSNLEIPDNHNCLNELNPPTPKYGSEMGEDTTLPAIYFKDQMYAREDFRDMLSAGIKIRPSNEMWNRDVEFLIENWKKHSTEASEVVRVDMLKEDSSMDYSEKQFSREKNRDNDDNLSFSNGRKSKQSTVQFLDHGTAGYQKAGDSRKVSRKSSLRPTSFPLLEIPLPEPEILTKTFSNILAARDSIELIIEQKQKSGTVLATVNENIFDEGSYITAEDVKMTNEDLGLKEGKELVVETRDSILLRKASLAKQSSTEFTVSPRDSIEIAKIVVEKDFEVRSKPSRLISARNSVELLKESLLKLREPSPICQKRDQEHPIIGFSETCCLRCKRKEENYFETGKNDSGILKPDSFSDEKSVKISQVQVINLDEDIAPPSIVSFHREPKIFNSATYTECIIETKKTIKNKKGKHKESKSRYTPKLKVVGDQDAKEGEQNYSEFTENRIHSLISLMKEHPPLMQLFTAGSR